MNELSGPQKFVKMFVSETTFDSMKAESQMWMMKCGNCNHERSIWDMGGIRWKASGRPRRYRACPNCGQRSWHMVYKRT